MAPKAETNPLGRHGKVGEDILPHDLDLNTPVEFGKEYAELVDDMDRRVEEMIRAERAETEREKQAKETLEPAGRRMGAMAVVDSVELAHETAA